MRQDRYTPGKAHQIDSLKEKFEALLVYISKQGGWLVSVPGNPDMRFQTLAGSALPGLLRDAGYTVTETGTSSRILPHVVRQELTTNRDGELVALTEGSTRAVKVVIINAGIAAVIEYDLSEPPAAQVPGRRIATRVSS
ncbi:hypothetical protein [Bradyrhizobium cosmicum]|uniref:hypothetical protein n=1 Tax=Bradyrhizobium cosmicum TaxID=1404864 RepID=UPI0028E8512E|nr:hypothetical protein [Bradyrhizobium cosmicum]